jgi:hypothetical protein
LVDWSGIEKEEEKEEEEEEEGELKVAVRCWLMRLILVQMVIVYFWTAIAKIDHHPTEHKRRGRRREEGEGSKRGGGGGGNGSGANARGCSARWTTKLFPKILSKTAVSMRYTFVHALLVLGDAKESKSGLLLLGELLECCLEPLARGLVDWKALDDGPVPA